MTAAVMESPGNKYKMHYQFLCVASPIRQALQVTVVLKEANVLVLGPL